MCSFGFHRFRSTIFDKEPRTGKPVVKNVDKTREMIELDRLVSSPKLQELKINRKTVLKLQFVGFKKKLDFECYTK